MYETETLTIRKKETGYLESFCGCDWSETVRNEEVIRKFG